MFKIEIGKKVYRITKRLITAKKDNDLFTGYVIFDSIIEGVGISEEGEEFALIGFHDYCRAKYLFESEQEAREYINKVISGEETSVRYFDVR